MNYEIEADKTNWDPAAATIAQLQRLGFYDKNVSGEDFAMRVMQDGPKNEQKGP